MPPLDSNLLDTQAIAMVTQWISGLSNSFWVGVSPPSQTLVARGPTNSVSVIVLPAANFNGAVFLSISDLPVGITAVFNPPSVTGSNLSLLKLSATGDATPGSYSLTLNGVGGGQTNTTALSIVIQGPRINSVTTAGTNLLISGASAMPGRTYYVLASTNITLPATNWTVDQTNVFDPTGAFLFTNPFSPAVPEKYYMLRVP